MRWMPLWLPGLAVIAALACAAPQAPREEGPGDSAPKRGGTLNMRVSVDPIDFDPTYNGKTSPGDEAQSQVYNSLLSFKNGPDVPYSEMILAPSLAERWEVSPDGRAFTFNLKKGIKFANLPPVNGREFTSADARWTIEYYTRTGEFADKGLPPAVHAGVFYQGFKTVSAPDPYTVKIEFNEPFVPFLSYAASVWNPMVPREIYDADGHMKDRIIGTGPYQWDVAGSQKGTRWVWKKNPDAWQADTTYVDEIRWIVLPQDATMLAAFQTKQIDLLHEGLAYRSFQEVKRANPDAVAHRYMQPQGYHLHFSQVRGGPFADVRVRRAVAMAIDRDELNRVVAGGEGEWAVTGAMHGLFTQEEARQIMKQDVDQANRLLSEAGYSGRLVLEWPIEESTSQDNLTWFQLVQAQLKKASVDMELVPMAKPEQRAKRRKGNFDVDVIVSTGLLEADADYMMTGVYHSKGAVNYGKSKDPELDRFLEAQRQATDPQKRREAQRAAARRIVEMAWGTELIYPPKWNVAHPYVKAYYPHFSVHGAHISVWLDK